MKCPKWISSGRKERVKDDIASIDGLKHGRKLKRKHGGRNLKSSTLEETSPTKVSSQCVVDIPKNVVIGSVEGRSDNKTPIAPPRETSLKNKRKSWYSISNQKSEGCKPRDIDPVSLCDQTGNLHDRMTTSQSTKHPRDDVSKITPNNSITIIVTSPSSEVHPKQEDWSSSSSSASSLSLSSLSSTSSLDTTRLMPPSVSSSIQKYPKSNEAPEVKKWLIGCMNRKADTLPRKLVYRMMEIYNIKEHELDPKMWDKLREGIEDEGIVLQVDMQDENKDMKREEFDGVEALRCLRKSFRSQAQIEGKEKKGGKGISEHFNDTVTTKRSLKNNNTNTYTNSKEQSQPKKVVPGANPRVWQNPSSRARNWPTTNMNISNGTSFSFTPYSYTLAHSKHRTSSKNHAYIPGNKNIYSTSNYSKLGICPPRRGSVISLSSIPEHDVSVEFDIGEEKSDQRAIKSRIMTTTTSTVRKGMASKRVDVVGEMEMEKEKEKDSEKRRLAKNARKTI